MNDEKRLDALLAALGRATDLDAPGGLEARLRARVSEVPSARAVRARRPARAWLLAAAVAAVAVAAGLSVVGGRPRPAAAPAAVRGLASAAPPVAAPPSAAPAAVAQAEPAKAAVRARGPARRAHIPPAPSRERARFIALPGAPALSDADGLHVARVRVPPTALEAWGWPPWRGEPRPLDAEVIVGHDGLARAIRFVTTEDGGR
jgi:hypothetical protein